MDRCDSRRAMLLLPWKSTSSSLSSYSVSGSNCSNDGAMIACESRFLVVCSSCGCLSSSLITFVLSYGCGRCMFGLCSVFCPLPLDTAPHVVHPIYFVRSGGPRIAGGESARQAAEARRAITLCGDLQPPCHVHSIVMRSLSLTHSLTHSPFHLPIM